MARADDLAEAAAWVGNRRDHIVRCRRALIDSPLEDRTGAADSLAHALASYEEALADERAVARQILDAKKVT